MKKQKLVLFALAALTLAGCGNPTTSSAAGTSTAGSSAATSTSKSATVTDLIGLVTDVGSINDHSFNQACWKGVQDFCTETGATSEYKQPSADSTTARVASIDALVTDGAKVVVMPGYKFNSTIKVVQDKYPNVLFLAVDCDPSDDDNNYTSYTFKSNVTSIKYYEHHSGYFAGYAAVREGYKKLGFLGGMAVPAVAKYGEGYVAGAEQAAKDMSLADGAITMNYWYSGVFTPNSDIATKMTSWYTAGTEVVFSCGGGIYSSCLTAAQNVNKATGTSDAKMIGVDVDQSSESPLIITSAFKKMEPLVDQYLTDAYKNATSGKPTFATAVAGQVVYKGVQDGDVDAGTNAVGLPTDEGSWRLTKWSVADYKAFFKKVKAGSPTIPEVTGSEANPNTAVTGLTKVVVTYETK
jgi:basic membrane protein A